MKYTIMGYNQEEVIKNELKLEDLCLLNVIKDFLSRPSFEKNESHQVWITNNLFMEDYPIFGFKDRMTLYRKLKKLEEKGLITKNSINMKNRKKKNFYGLTKKYETLVFTNVTSESTTNVTSESTTNVTSESTTNVTNMLHNSFTLQTNNTNKHDNKEEKTYFTDPNIDGDFKEFLRTRDKKKNTDISIKRLVNLLNKYDDDTKMRMIDNSIIGGYQGIFELNDKKNKDKNKFVAPEWEEQKENNTINTDELNDMLNV